MRPNINDDETAITKHIGKRLRTARQLRGHTQKELADFLGITHQQVQKYETGKNRIPITKLVILARVLKLQPDFFFKNLPGCEEDDLDDLLAISSMFLEAVHVIKHRPEFAVIREVVCQFARAATSKTTL